MNREARVKQEAAMAAFQELMEPYGLTVDNASKSVRLAGQHLWSLQMWTLPLPAIGNESLMTNLRADGYHVEIFTGERPVFRVYAAAYIRSETKPPTAWDERANWVISQLRGLAVMIPTATLILAAGDRIRDPFVDGALDEGGTDQWDE